MCSPLSMFLKRYRLGILCTVILYSACESASSNTKVRTDIFCHKLKDAEALRGLHTEIPDRAMSGGHLKQCDRNGATCCNPFMENKLIAHSKLEFQEQLRDNISQLRLILSAQAQRFDDFFKELLKISKNDFHQMFLKTYGMLYDRNSYIFEDLFDNLERYYLKGGVNLNDALEDFFDKLYRKMFQVLNSQYTFSDVYMNCVSQYMEEMKPFGDVPKKLTVEIKRSFVATRTFVQAMVTGRDIVKHLEEVGPTAECTKALMRLSKCSYCKGHTDVKPCANFCLNVMRGCFAYLADVQIEWNNYINAMMMLASRLESSFNIESVVNPIDIKISDAIMNFQENGQAVSQELFKQCGQPRLGKRSARHELNYETVKFGHQQNSVRPTTAAGTSIDRLVKRIVNKIKKTKGFWTHLSKLFCSNPSLTDDSKSLPEQNCWNGVEVGQYEAAVVGDGIANQTKNPEITLSPSHQEWIVNQQILTLQLITTKLTHAYNGLDVLWQDTSDSDWISSGSGSGSGYGDKEETTTSFGDIYFSVSTSASPTHLAPEPKHPTQKTTPSSSCSWQPSTILLIVMSALWLLGLPSSYG